MIRRCQHALSTWNAAVQNGQWQKERALGVPVRKKPTFPAQDVPAAGERARGHVPVLRAESLQALNLREGGIYVDGTFGAGGHARGILAVPDTRLVAIDRDPQAVALAEELASEFPGRVHVHHGRFSEMEQALTESGFGAQVDGVMLDIGVSSMQLDDAGRGFSFMHDGPLDMRMEQSGTTAADVVNTLSEEELADILFSYGEERKARPLARAIVKARKTALFSKTSDLVRVVETVLGRKRPRRAHPATRTFQALRIYVNRELEELVEGLAAAERILKPGGRLVVITFHSLEDRIVKRFLARRTGRAAQVRPLPGMALPHMTEFAREEPEPSFRDMARGGIVPTEEEVSANPRARSARLRVGERTQASPIPPDPAFLGLPAPGRFRGPRRRYRHGKG